MGQTAPLSLTVDIWGAMTLMWCHCNGTKYHQHYRFGSMKPWTLFAFRNNAMQCLFYISLVLINYLVCQKLVTAYESYGTAVQIFSYIFHIPQHASIPPNTNRICWVVVGQMSNCGLAIGPRKRFWYRKRFSVGMKQILEYRLAFGWIFKLGSTC